MIEVDGLIVIGLNAEILRGASDAFAQKRTRGKGVARLLRKTELGGLGSSGPQSRQWNGDPCGNSFGG
jgi:hypothetical protein